MSESGASGVLHAIKMAARHFGAELTNDYPLVFETISKNAAAEQTRATYGDHWRDGWLLTGWEPHTQVVTDWYVFYEGFAAHRFTDKYWKVDGTPGGGAWMPTDNVPDLFTPPAMDGKNSTVPVPGKQGEECYNVAILFPVDDDGIVVELAAMDERMREDALGRDGDPRDVMLPFSKRELHDSFANALRKSDLDALQDLVSDNCQLRTIDICSPEGKIIEVSGREAVRQYYASMLDAVEIVELDVLQRVTGGWYVFAEHELRLRSTGRVPGTGPAGTEFTAQTATMYNMLHGLITGQIGHARSNIPG